ncbi:DUF3955 domain-containing protein [Chryseobacterium daeguense]|uniref:DUF3955 domain-containing protein n=1 Tax=Chryseobacterium daeguense TaxID=412438 RepID=UPI000482BC8A|nr:DUF3955 domain-containing protein [Chryseobacterium daeguense]
MKKLNLLSITILSAGVLCFVIKMITESMDATKSSTASDGTLNEPFFFLIPAGFILLFVGIFLYMYKLIADKFFG